MKKVSFKLNRDELKELAQIIRNIISDFDHQRVVYNSIPWSSRLLHAILRDVILHKIMTKLLLPKAQYTLTFKEFEAEALSNGVLLYEIQTSNPYTIALIEKIKSTQLV